MTNANLNAGVIIASYEETEALPVFLHELVRRIHPEHFIVIADDSSVESFQKIKQIGQEISNKSGIKIFYSHSDVKSGRGNAIHRGMRLANEISPMYEFLVECDADGSHSADDIARILQESPRFDLIIGSRYLKKSRIIGWPVSRRVFSLVLNKSIPILTRIRVSDATNGLRRYSRKSVKIQTGHTFKSNGFIRLAEQLKLLQRNGIYAYEVPTTFVNRLIGSSTVTYKEIFASLVGLFRIVISR